MDEETQKNLCSQEYIEIAKKNARMARDLDYRNVPLAAERAWEILHEELDKDTRPQIVALYKDIMSRHVSQVETRVDKIENPDPRWPYPPPIDVTPREKISYQELKARSIDAWKSFDDAEEWKQKQLVAKSEKESDGSNL